MKKIMYFSTNGHPEPLDFKEALLFGQAPDRGLYVPGEIPKIPTDEIGKFAVMDYRDIAERVMRPFLRDLVPLVRLRSMLNDAYNFDIPIEPVFDGKFIMRLDRGPTCSFKDFAARLMGRLMQYFLIEEDRRVVILTATSGDTGSAVAHAFFGLENIEVVVLFPEKEVTGRQRKQMTTLGGNVHVLAVDGKFDDCQAIVKQAFADPDLQPLNLSSANSINVGRLLPQTVYYFYAHSRTAADCEEAVISVPCGNFGNLMGGLFAKRMGLPVRRFVAATNENDEFPAFMKSGSYRPIRPSRNCISNAMNVGHPSNLARLIHIYGGQMDETGKINRMPDMATMRRDIFSVSISDDETRRTIKEAYHKNSILLEPHGAVGWAGLKRYLAFVEDWSPCVSLETADPAKFPEEIVRATGVEPEIPEAMSRLHEMEEQFDCISGDYNAFKRYLERLFGA